MLRIPRHIIFLASLFAFWVFIFTLDRLATFWLNLEKATPATHAGLKNALWLGCRFDMMVAAYGLLLPFHLLTISWLCPKSSSKWVGKTIRGYAVLASVVALVICTVDLPYFSFFNSRITTAILLWQETPGQVAKFIVGSPEYYPFLLLIVLGVWLIVRMVDFLSIWKKQAQKPIANQKSPLAKYSWPLFSFGLIFLAMRGGTAPRPLILRESFHSNDGFLNQLSINPVHSWFDSFQVFNIHFMEDTEALAMVKNCLKIPPAGSTAESPIGRLQKADSTFFAPGKKRPNVVLFLVESLSAERMAFFGNQKNLTPFLDSLASKSLFLSNLYSSGIHTAHGMMGTLFAQPSLFGNHPMSDVGNAEKRFSGIPTALKAAGYRNFFFLTHDKTFDNMGWFLPRNGYDWVSDLSDYPSESVVNSWGVSDNSLIHKSLQVLDSVSAEDAQPFFATILTMTTHPPYELPPDSARCPNLKSERLSDRVWEYSDWCIGQFFREAASKKWFDNTVFVLLGDHGWVPPDHASPFDVVLPQCHVPCLFFAPKILAPEVNEKPASQMDVYPTLMHLLGIEFVNNSLGINLLQDKRPFAVFSQDSKIGIVGERFLYVIRRSGSTALYDFRAGKGENLETQFPALADSMRLFGGATLQTAQFLQRKLEIR